MLIYLLETNLCEAAYFQDCMRARGREVRHVSRSADLLDALVRQRPALVVLDWIAPDLPGLEALKRIRMLHGQALPVMMLTGVSHQEHIVAALDAGADDYLVKPVTRPLLVARVEAMLRRASPAAEPLREVRCGPFKLDYRQQLAVAGGRRIALTQKEFDIAWTLFTNANRFVTKADLVATVWGRRAEIAGHTLTQHMHTLRRKLNLEEFGFRLVAVYGTGYRLQGAADAVFQARHEELASVPQGGPSPAGNVLGLSPCS